MTSCYRLDGIRFNRKFLVVKQACRKDTTEAILIEIGNALSTTHREAAVHFIDQCYVTSNIHVVSVDTGLLKRALNLYDERTDKEWGLTDCISFVVMSEQNLGDAMTTDRHFTQAGFRAIMREMESE